VVNIAVGKGVGVGVRLGKGIGVDVGGKPDTSGEAVGVRPERSSRTMVGVGVALLNVVQAVKTKNAKIEIIQVLIQASIIELKETH
jgi:hypothetical protein